MSKSRLGKSHKSLIIYFVLFVLVIIFNYLGFSSIGKILFYIMIIVFFWGWCHTFLMVKKGNRRALNRFKNKEPVLTDSLTDDEEQISDK